METRWKNQSGASAVEFALILPILVLLVFGIIEFSLALYDKAMITNASREGARAGIVFRAHPQTGEYSPLTDAEVMNIVNNYLSNHLITFGATASATSQIARNGSSPGGELTVTVTYPYGFLVLPRFVTSLTGTINLTAATVMRME